ncbi:hypothetical protein OSB04_010872 [Centaurea solstitialis]|uniref:Retrovirus-related Pol polyprotein from transposon TNT 1-94-like beta-barrel domain-containing protein n=1 Tax=Centaurea solstitialis TaxID=347529 RepID=A0AA38T8D8_9ASTR|nr:hypothetical protein OSB04_010872 [Centaurea solstitialis]
MQVPLSQMSVWWLQAPQRESKGVSYKPSFKNSLAPQKKHFKNLHIISCWVFGKPRHRAKDFRHKRDHNGGGNGGGGVGPHHQANFADSKTQFIIVVEANMWLDTGDTRHICNSKISFATYQKVSDEESMSMVNASKAKVEGKRKVILKLTSEKDLVLTNVLHIPDIRKNLI